MSKQALNLNEDWEKVKEAFRDHFKSENTEIHEQVLTYSKNGEELKITEDGKTSGVMPLHQNRLSGVDKITFRDSEVELESNTGTYVFRR